jgi:hypothetical protein
MRVFRRSFASAEISVCFSQGFNPHPRLSFGPSLRTGWEGRDEYMDVLLEVPEDDLALRCNRHLPEGLWILEAAVIDGSVPKLAADVTGARYEIHLAEADVFECPPGIRKPLLERVSEKTPLDGPSWRTRVLEELTAALGECFSGDKASSEVRHAGEPTKTPVILEVQCERPEGDADTPVTVRYFSTMHGARSLFPEDILTPLLGDTSRYVTPIGVVRTSLYVERGGRYVSPISRAALEIKA